MTWQLKKISRKNDTIWGIEGDNGLKIAIVEGSYQDALLISYSPMLLSGLKSIQNIIEVCITKAEGSSRELRKKGELRTEMEHYGYVNKSKN